MQFGHVLAFATLVLASPTPMKLEDRAITFSGLISQAVNSIVTDLTAVVNTNTATALPLIASISTETQATASSSAALIVSYIKNIEAAVTSAEQSIGNSIYTGLTNGTATITSLILGELQKTSDALAPLVTALQNANLTSIANVTVSSSVNGVAKTINDESAALQKLVQPFVAALSNLSASLAAKITLNPTSIIDLTSAINTFLKAVGSNQI